MRHFRLLASAVVLAGTLGISTAWAKTMTPAEATKIVDQAMAAYGPIKVLHTAPGPGDLTAALISSGKHEAIVWIVGDGQGVLLGHLLGPNGQDLAHDAAVQMGVLPKPLAPADLAAAVAKSKTFMVGQSGPELTAFLDPNCIYCHDLYKQAEPLIAAGKLHLRVVLVGVIKPSSFAKAAAILGAKDPAAALATDEAHFDVAKEEGGIEPAAQVPPELGAAIKANAKLLEQSGEAATPTLLFKNQAGVWRIVHGVPEGGIAAVLAEIGS